jgi:transposase
VSCCPASPSIEVEERSEVRTIGLDIHKRFAEVALHEDGQVRRLGRVGTSTSELRAFAASLRAEDHVVVESTSFTWALVELLSRHAGRVTVSNPLKTKAIASAKVKTDKVDAQVLAQLGAADFIPEVWQPDAETIALRRRIAHRASLVRQRTRLRNQVHAVLARNLIAVPVTDLFGKEGRRLLDELELPWHEQEQLGSALRLHDAVAAEVHGAERSLAERALASTEVRRLMTIPGVGAITALALTSVIGDVSRFPSPRHLVGYLGLDPRVRQSGERQARTGHISRQGQSHARGLLIEAAHSAVRTPGPLRAFYLRLRDRRGRQIALVAAARKLAVYCWHLLAKQEDYRFEAPSLTRRKLRALQDQARTPGRRISYANEREKALDRRLLEQAERDYRGELTTRSDGAGAAKGDATLTGPRGANDARQARSPHGLRFSSGVTRAGRDPRAAA